MKKIRLIDWPYPDRPKLQQIRMTWREMRREGLGHNVRRLRAREIAVVMVVFFVGFSFALLLMMRLFPR